MIKLLEGAVPALLPRDYLSNIAHNQTGPDLVAYDRWSNKAYNVVNCIFYDVTLGWSKGSGGLLYQSKLK